MPWGQPTNFKEKIQAGVKIHTFRMGDRWQPGMLIHFWEENPRNTSVNPAPFQLPRFDLAELWYGGKIDMVTFEKADEEPCPKCFAVEQWEMKIELVQDEEVKRQIAAAKTSFQSMNEDQRGTPEGQSLKHQIESLELRYESEKEVTLKIGDVYFDTPELLELVAINDGFESAEQFIEWFWLYFQGKGITEAKGQVIHWTDQVYDAETAQAETKVNL